MKYTTIVFKDHEKNLYIGELTGKEITGFKNITVAIDPKDPNTSAYKALRLNEFLILDVEHVGNDAKLTPLTVCSLSANLEDGTPDMTVPPDIYALPHEKILEIFNGVLNPAPAKPKKGGKKKKASKA